MQRFTPHRNRRHENAQQAGPACPAIDLEKNWRRKEKQLADSVQAIDLIGAPLGDSNPCFRRERPVAMERPFRRTAANMPVQ
jgi:hypothetical protein